MAGAQLVLLARALPPLHRVRQPRAARARRGCCRRCCARHLVLRGVLLAAGAIVLPLAVPAGAGALMRRLRCSRARAREILGRYLFFVSVVPKHMAAPYVAAASEAA